MTGESDAVVSAPLEELPDILAVMEGSLVIETDDDGAVRTAIQGLRYLLAIEFARQQPALALLYDLDLQELGIRRGSREVDFKIWARIKRRVRAAVRKAGAVAVLSVVLGIPAVIVSTAAVWHGLFPPVQEQLCRGMPSTQININVTVRPPDDRDVPPKQGGEWSSGSRIP